ncbi:hypothetical protein FACS189434_13980 [Bacteroidia bacterium]|nr:hypothetical protein FACS189434_13980 [Bacteroidia bacterium]
MKNTVKLLVTFLFAATLCACGDKKKDEPLLPTPDASIEIQSNVEQRQLLELDSTFLFNYVSNSEVSQASWVLEAFTKNDEGVTIAFTDSNAFAVKIAGLAAIPAGKDYKRAENGMISAQIVLKGLFADGKNFERTLPVSLPAKPEKPTLEVVSIIDHKTEMESDVVISFSAVGDVRYRLYTQLIGSSSISTYNLPEHQNTYSFTDLWLDFGYIIKVSAINKYGESEKAEVTFEENPDYYSD